MGRLGAAIFLSLVVGPFAPDLVQAEVWQCPGPNGTVLFTNTLKDPATCRQYVPATELIPAPSPSEAPLLPQAPSDQPSPADTQLQAPEPYVPPDASYYGGYDYYYPGYFYYGSPPVYWFFSRPWLSPFRARPHVRSFQAPFAPPMNSAPGRSSLGGVPSSRHR